MPHINLLYPFHEDATGGCGGGGGGGACFDAAAARATAALVGVPPFLLRLTSFGFFQHHRSCTLWLDPGNNQALLNVQRALEAAFPACNDLSSVISSTFKPHLSLGQWRSAKEVQLALAELTSAWQPLEFTVDHVCLISRGGYHDPFRVRYEVPLGAGEGQTARLVCESRRQGEESVAGGSDGDPLQSEHAAERT
eukprot:SM000071S21078  [mRNA]  locus=s71:271195:272951:- [translate_table: standard]